MEPNSKTPQAQSQKISEFADQSEDKLIRMKTKFPFKLRAHYLIIGRNKISYIQRFGFKNEKITSINIEDVLNVDVYLTTIMGALRLRTRFYSKQPLEVTHLSRKDALRAKQLIQGLVVCREKGIEIDKVPRADLLIQLERIGKA